MRGVVSVGPRSTVLAANCRSHPADVGELLGSSDVDVTTQAGGQWYADVSVVVEWHGGEDLFDPVVPVGIEFLDAEVGDRVSFNQETV